jgi:hypothetical protein
MIAVMRPNSDQPDGNDDEPLPGDDEPMSDEEMTELDRPLHEVLGINPNFAPDHLAPPVDRDRLLAFTRNQLPPEQRDEVLALIASFRPWLQGWADAMRRKMAEERNPPHRQ